MIGLEVPAPTHGEPTPRRIVFILTSAAITFGACLALAGCGVLCPQMYGLALGLYDRNLGLIGGVVSAACYVIVSAAMALAGVLPENSQAPLGWLYIGLSACVGILILATTSTKRDARFASQLR